MNSAPGYRIQKDKNNRKSRGSLLTVQLECKFYINANNGFIKMYNNTLRLQVKRTAFKQFSKQEVRYEYNLKFKGKGDIISM